MTVPKCDIRQTKANTGLVLHNILAGKLSIVVYLSLLIALLKTAVESGDYTIFSFVAGLILFGLHIETIFMKEKFSGIDEQIEESNLASYLSTEIVRHIHGKGNLTTNKLFNASLKSIRSSFVINMLGIEKSSMAKKVKSSLQNIDAQSFLKDALAHAKDLGIETITAPVILSTFLRSGGVFKELLNECDISINDLDEIVQWEVFSRRVNASESTLSPESFVRAFGSFGRGWVQGYTSELDRVTDEISGSVQWRSKKRGLMIHKKKIESAVHILSRSGQKNMLFVGDKDVGKETLIENIGTLLRKDEMENGKELTRLLVLRTEEILSGYKHPDRVLLRALSKAEKAGKFVIIIKDISLFMQSSDSNVRTVLSKFLQSKSIGGFAVASADSYHKYVKGNSAFDSQFEKIYVEAASGKEALSTLMVRSIQLQKEKGKNTYITFRALKMLLRLTERYMTNAGLPGSAISVLEDAILTANNEKQKYVLESHIRKAISLKARVDVEDVSTDEKQKLLQLKETLSTSIIGQDESIDALVGALKRAKMDINAGNRPLGTFLFLGPTGVGKTHTAKILSNEYFGGEESLIRVDMNEYGTEESVYGIIGDTNPSGSGQSYLTKRVQDHPFSLLLLDEIEKAHPAVLNVFLQILDEGHLTDNKGKKTDFRNTIIIATSNAGALFIRDFIAKNSNKKKDEFKKSLVDTIIKDRTFSPEFINRFDEVLLYYPLNIHDTISIALLMLDGIVTEIAEKKGFNIRVEEDIVAEIVKRGYSVEFGAREMRRVIVDIIENYLADYLLQNKAKRGDTIKISLKEVKDYLKSKE